MQAMNAPDEPARLIRVLIVEDHPVVAEGLASLLEDYPEITISGVAFSVAEVSPAIEKATADVAVIDYHLPDGTAYDAADRIQSRSPSTAIVLISADAGSEPLLAAIEVGASGYPAQVRDRRGDRPDDPRCGRGRDRHTGWHHHAGPGPVPRRRPAARAPGTARKSDIPRETSTRPDD